MKINDRIYGEIEIDEPVILEIINTQEFLRLKDITQDGAAHFLYPQMNVSRYEHSIGVWYLSKLFDRSLEEQIASLIHDISHMAFSHVIDVVMNDHSHGYADNQLEEVIMKSEIPEILHKYNIDLSKVLDKSDFPILDNSLPDISIDRLDYIMRDAVRDAFAAREIVIVFLQSLKIESDRFYFQDLGIASSFALFFLNVARLDYNDPDSFGSYHILSSAIKIALNENIISEKDFHLTEKELYNLLKQSTNQKLQTYLDRLNPNTRFEYAEKTNAEFYGKNKVRLVDPLVKINGEFSRVSHLNTKFVGLFEEFRKKYGEVGVREI